MKVKVQVKVQVQVKIQGAGPALQGAGVLLVYFFQVLQWKQKIML